MSESTFIQIYTIFHIFILFFSGYILFKAPTYLMTKSAFIAFRIFVNMFMLYTIINTVWSLQECDAIQLPFWLFKTIIFLYLSSVIFVSFCFFAYILLSFDFEIKNKAYYNIVGILPYAIGQILLIISLFTDIVFTVSEDMNMVYGPLFMVLLGIAFTYFIIIVFVSIRRAVKLKTPSSKRDATVMTGSILFLTAWVIYDSMYIQKVTILTVAIFAVIFFIFINMLQSKIDSDALTQLNNRRRAEDFISDQLKSVSESSPVFLYMIDINSFKDINDEFGHTEGDKALLSTATILKDVVENYKGFLARYGGDEFIFTIKPQKLVSFDPVFPINEIQYKLGKTCVENELDYNITLSIGYTCCTDPSKSLVHYIKEADQKLYSDKNKYHSSDR